MMKRVLLLAGIAFSASAFAGTVDATTSFSAAGVGTSHAAPLAAAAAPAGAQLAKGTVIYSNFSSDKANLYDCCNGWTVRGASIGLGYQRMAMPFTPATDTHLRRVLVALGRAGGLQRLDGTLQEDDDGLPGDVISEVVVEGFPDLGTCCDTEVVRGFGVPLQAGKTYWIVANPRDLSSLAWNKTITGDVGPGAFDTGSGWQSFTDAQGAFEVIGD